MIVASLLMILHGCLSTSSAGAEDDEAGGWEYSVTPFLGAPSVKGDVTVRGRSSSVDASFKDIVEQSDSILAYFSHFEARNGRLALFAEPSYMDIGMSENAKVGARTLVQLSDRWVASLRGDIGGFGVGSDLSLQGIALVGYEFDLFGRAAMAFGGYRALYQDYDNGSGANRFEWDVTLHGPVLGLNMRF